MNLQLRKVGSTGTYGLAIVRTSASGTKNYFTLLDKDGNFLPDINAKIKALPKIQTGTITITTDEANTPVGQTITFPTAFESVPSVFANAKTAAPGTGMTGISVTDITKTGCTIYVTRSTANATTGINWVAIRA